MPVRIREFVGAWSAIPARLQTRLGAAHATLGRGATLGPRVFSRQQRIEVRIGPLGLADYERFLPGGSGLADLRLALLHGLGETLDVDVRPVLRRDEIPDARFGTARLGRTAWLKPAPHRRRRGPAPARLVGLDTEGARAAA